MVKMVILQSSDGEKFEVEREVIRLSVAINTMLVDLGFDDNEDDQALAEPIPLQNVNAVTLKKVLVWMEKHRGEPAPSEDDDATKEKRTDDIPKWDQDFFKVDQGTLFEVILAANYMEIRGLLDMGCKTVANMIKGKTAEEIRRTFNIKNDFTPEEEEQIRRENAWCED